MGLQEWFSSGAWLIVLFSSILTATGAAIVTYIIAAGKKARTNREEELMKKVDEHLKPTFENLTAVLTDIKVELDASKKRDERSDRAMLQIMRTNLHVLFDACKKNGFTTSIERSRFIDLYSCYRELGGNHEMEALYAEFLKMDSAEVHAEKLNTKKK